MPKSCNRGGNAADAAVAAAFAVGVVEPFMSGLGGAAYVVAHEAATGHTLTLDGSIELPQAASPDLFELLDPDSQGLGVYGWRGTKDNANGMMWFDPEPGRINSIAPRKRALHAGTPAIVFDDATPVLALGSPGGRKVLTAVQQIIHNVVDFGLGMQEAVSAPRIHCESGVVHMDARLPGETIEGVRAMGHTVSVREEHFLSSYFARPNAIMIDNEQGVLRSGLEPYKLSTAVGY